MRCRLEGLPLFRGLVGAALLLVFGPALEAQIAGRISGYVRDPSGAGVAAGGPVRKNRLFAFASLQRLWNRPETGSSQVLVPTDAERQGDFRGIRTALRNITDPLTAQPVMDPTGRPCVAGNVISSGCISPAAKKLRPKRPGRRPYPQHHRPLLSQLPHSGDSAL